MSRLPQISHDGMTPEQRRVHDAIVGGRRGTIQGPFLAWLANPSFADAAQKLGEYCRFDTTLPRDLAELAICVTAAHYRAEFEWWAHARMAHEAGLPEAVTAAIRRGAEPRLDTAAARAVYRTAVALNRRHRLTDAEFADAQGVLGQQGLVDVVGLCGYYALVSLTLNAFEVPVPDGSRAFD
jgi:4-carboxymuconolactone decarboxylase